MLHSFSSSYAAAFRAHSLPGSTSAANHAGEFQNVLFNLGQVGLEGFGSARPVAFGGRAGLVPHDLRNSACRCPGGLSEERKRTAQAMQSHRFNLSALQHLDVAGANTIKTWLRKGQMVEPNPARVVATKLDGYSEHAAFDLGCYGLSMYCTNIQ